MDLRPVGNPLDREPIHFALTPSRGLCVYRGPRVVASWPDPEAMPSLLMTLALGGNQVDDNGVLHQMTEAQRRQFAVLVATFWAQ